MRLFDDCFAPGSPDLHAFLDAGKAPLELVGYRVDYYRRLLITVFQTIGVPIDKLEFVVGT